MKGLKLSGIKKSYGPVTVVHDVDLDIAPGEFVVFVGPSGCGKSTLLRMIAGLEDITAGELQIGDTRMNDVDPSKRGIAMVFQSYALYPHLTVAQNMGLALKYAGKSKAEIETIVHTTAETLELSPLLDRLPKDLSGGQRQRVAIGRSIVREPDVFLFDEPLSNLDAELRGQMRIELAQLHQRLKSTIVYVTHDQVEAMTLADKIVVLRDGRVEQVGAPLELYDRPANLFVAGFIGAPRMNFLRGVVQSDRLIIPSLPGQSLPVPKGLTPLSEGQEVTLGIRPEHFDKNSRERLDLTIDIVEHLGGQTFAYSAEQKGETLIVALGGDRSVRSGDRISVGVDMNHILLFDENKNAIATMEQSAPERHTA